MKKLQEVFHNGAEGYTPSAMWFTSGNIHKKEMTYQIEQFRKQGIQDYFIHPSDGTQGDYLGEHFFSMIRHAADEAKRLGMHFWIYDDYNWPSGIAGGQVLADEPWTHYTCLTRIVQTAAAGQTVHVSLPEKEKCQTKVLLVIADGKPVDLTPEGDTIIWTNTASEEKTLEVYLSMWTTRVFPSLKGSEIVAEGNYGYLDTLDQEAVAVFIEKTHEAYKKHVGEDFGGCVKGVFTDEVPMVPMPNDWNDVEFPWSRLFPEKFKERNGYDILPRLKELMEASDVKLTIDYWETATELFMNAFMGQIYQWCTDNNLIFTGHLLSEESICETLVRSGDPYEYYKRFTWPGIDSILTYYWIDNYDYNIAGKRASSAAHFLKKERLLSETYTVSGWEIRLRDMKRIFNRLAVLGVNFIQFMGSRYDFMPGYDHNAMTNNWQNPLFEHYGEMSRYFSGVQYLVANATYDAHTLLLYPMTAARAELPPVSLSHRNRDMDMTLCGLINSLLSLGVPFEMAFEQVIEEAEVADGWFQIGDEKYDTILLPCTTYLKEKTFQKLQAFARGGGRVLQINGRLEKVIGEQAYEAPALANAISYDCREYETVRVGEALHRGPMGKFTDCLRQALGEPTGAPVKLTPCDGVMSAFLKKEQDRYVMLINDYDATLTVQGEALVDLPFRALNTETGEQKPMRICGRHFELELAPYECAVIELSSSIDKASVLDAAPARKEIPLDRIGFAPDDANTALPAMWQVRGKACEEILKARRAYNPKRVCDLAATLSDEDLVPCCSEGNRFDRGASKREWFGWTPADGKKPEAGESVVCIYDFTVDELPEVLELVSDPQWNTVWYLNNEQLYQTDARRIWHYANPVFDLSGVAVPGKNRLVSICTLPEYEAPFPLPCAVLKGSFRFFKDQILTQKPGGNAFDYWNDQGYMCYTGKGTYSAAFAAPSSGRVILEISTKDVAEVVVNGTPAGKRLWDPYRLDITPFLVPGDNQLEIRITSTLSNLLYNGIPSGLGSAKIYVEE